MIIKSSPDKREYLTVNGTWKEAPKGLTGRVGPLPKDILKIKI